MVYILISLVGQDVKNDYYDILFTHSMLLNFSPLQICRPYTGRTHQLRLHLQHLEHPIANDPNYGGDIWYKNSNGQECCDIAQNRLNIINSNTVLDSNEEVCEIVTDTPSIVDEPISKKIATITTKSTTQTSAIDVPATEIEVNESVHTSKQEKEESIHEFIERTCVWCARTRAARSEDRAVLEFVIRSPGIWLHALQYSFPANGLSSNDDSKDENKIVNFRTKLPSWHDF